MRGYTDVVPDSEQALKAAIAKQPVAIGAYFLLMVMYMCICVHRWCACPCVYAVAPLTTAEHYNATITSSHPHINAPPTNVPTTAIEADERDFQLYASGVLTAE